MQDYELLLVYLKAEDKEESKTYAMNKLYSFGGMICMWKTNVKQYDVNEECCVELDITLARLSQGEMIVALEELARVLSKDVVCLKYLFTDSKKLEELRLIDSDIPIRAADDNFTVELIKEKSIRKSTFEVGIDCAPGTARPDYYIQGVIDLFNRKDIVVGEPKSKSFGAWTWEFDGITKEEYESVKNNLRDYIEDLYKSGSIRGAVWDMVDNDLMCEKCGCKKTQLSTSEEAVCIYCMLKGK